MQRRERRPMGDIAARALGLVMVLVGSTVLLFLLTDRAFSAAHAEWYRTYKTSYFMPRIIFLMAAAFVFPGLVMLAMGRRFDEFLVKKHGQVMTLRQWKALGIGMAAIFVTMFAFQWHLDWPTGRPPFPAPRPALSPEDFARPPLGPMSLPEDFRPTPDLMERLKANPPAPRDRDGRVRPEWAGEETGPR